MPPQPPTEEATIDHHSRTALASTKRNLRYLYSPTTNSSQISSRRTRALLRVVRSSLIFIFWRIVRYAKYVALGSLVATLGAGAFGTVVSGAGFVVAPTGILGTVAAGSVYGVGKYVVRRVQRKWGERGGYEPDVEEQEEEMERGRGGRWEEDVDAMPW